MPSDLDGKKIAIVRMSAIGDVVHTLPLVVSLRAAAPSAHLTWIIQPTPHQLIQNHPAVDDFILFRRRPIWKGYEGLRRQLSGRYFDMVVVPQTSFKAAVATAMIPSSRKIGFDRRRSPELSWLVTNERLAPAARGHQQSEILEFVDHLGIEPLLEWQIGPTAAELARYAPHLPPHQGRTVAFSIASSNAKKDWAPENFAELARRLLSLANVRIILVGGLSPAEDQAAKVVTRGAGGKVLDLRAWDLRRLAFLIHSSAAFVGPDSGPLHIAVALGTPSVALMGYTNPARFGPYRFRELMVDVFSDPGEEPSAAEKPRAGRMQRITVEQVEEKVLKALERP